MLPLVMDVTEKLTILAQDAQYDLSCACGTKNPKEHRKRSSDGTWLYPVPVGNGGEGIMLKTLLSNVCTNDCKYCPLREDSDTKRVSLLPDDVAKVFIQLQSQRPLIGLFLSSAVVQSPDYTMDRMLATAEILRKQYHYRGYIHLKIIPGSSYAAIDKALSLSSAVSLNIETPGERYLSQLSKKKRFTQDIIEPLKYISDQTAKGSAFSRVHTTSQFLVGASDEMDKEILNYTWGMYKRLGFDRLYYSAFQDDIGDNSLKKPDNQLALFAEPHYNSKFLREHRLYQADYLFRQYGFSYDDLVFQSNGNLDVFKDPKQVWADTHEEHFPVSVKRGSKEDLLKVPGLGPVSVKKIISLRKSSAISSLESLHLPRYLLQKAQNYLVL